MVELNETKAINQERKINRNFRFFGLTVFFFGMSDGILSYFAPKVVVEAGYSNTQMGILMALSSVFGAILDIVLSRVLRNTHYYRLYFYALLLMISFPFLLLTSSYYFLLLISMAIWALYCNLSSFGYYDYIARVTKKSEHASSFGFLDIYSSMGYVVAPLIAGTIAITSLGIKGAVIPIFVSIMGLIFLIATRFSQPRKEKSVFEVEHKNTRSFLEEMVIWKRVIVRMWPMLILFLSLCIMEAVFWTMAPVIELVSANLKGYGGIILTAAIVPSLLINWSVGPLTKLFGKKNTAYTTFLFSNVFLFIIGFVNNPGVIVLLIFITYILQSITFPAMGGAIADYLKESQSYDREILSTKDFFGNLGYIIGPAITGILMDRIGGLGVFSYMAIMGFIISLILIFFAPRRIPFYDRNIEVEENLSKLEI
ncbi:MFS transporter [Candidatus Dojkabacteria bacterium]|nr:MFS transporter [Candidatus Dojkabacteria bacterium]